MTNLQFVFTAGIPSALIVASGVHQNLRLHRLICAMDAFHKQMDINDRKNREKQRIWQAQLAIIRPDSAMASSCEKPMKPKTE